VSLTGEKVVRFWTVRELGEFLRVPRTWIYERTRENGPETIPHIKLGKYVRFNPESKAFREWLERHEKGGSVGASHRGLQALESKGRI
jgi:hypothetical protein